MIPNTSKSRPAILLLQGALQLPDVYQNFTAALKSKGFHVVQPDFPSIDGPDKKDFLSKSLLDDAASAEKSLRLLVQDEDRPVIVFAHSYGGLVGCQAVAEDLTYANRKARGLPGGVLHLFFLAAMILPKGDSIESRFERYGHAPADGRYHMDNPEDQLYHDLDPEEAAYWAGKVVDQSYAVQTTELTRCSATYCPSTYLVCRDDQAVSSQFQEFFAKSAGSEVRYIASGHSPMLNKISILSRMIIEVADSAMLIQSSDAV